MKNEDTTKNLPHDESFEARVLSELAALRGELAAIRGDQAMTRKEIAAVDARVTAMDDRLTSLEDKVDARLKETRPIWEAVQEAIRRLDRKFDQVIKDLYEVRADYRSYDDRLLQVRKETRSIRRAPLTVGERSLEFEP